MIEEGRRKDPPTPNARQAQGTGVELEGYIGDAVARLLPTVGQPWVGLSDPKGSHDWWFRVFCTQYHRHGPSTSGRRRCKKQLTGVALNAGTVPVGQPGSRPCCRLFCWPMMIFLSDGEIAAHNNDIGFSTR